MVDFLVPFIKTPRLLNFQKTFDPPIQEYIKMFKKSVLWSFYYKAVLSVIPIKIAWNFLSVKVTQKF